MGDLGESDSERCGDQGDPFSVGERALNGSSRSISVPWSIVFAQLGPRESLEGLWVKKRNTANRNY